MLALLIPGSLLAGLAGAGLALWLVRRARAAEPADAAVEARIVVSERRIATLERSAERQSEELALRCRQLKGQMHEVANVLKRLAEHSKAIGGAEAKRSALVVSRLTEQVEGLADRVFDLDARVRAMLAGPGHAPEAPWPAPNADGFGAEGFGAGALGGAEAETETGGAGDGAFEPDASDLAPAPFPVYEPPADGAPRHLPRAD